MDKRIDRAGRYGNPKKKAKAEEREKRKINREIWRAEKWARKREKNELRDEARSGTAWG